jgi:uncharacterized protein YgiM (DUF1202 family)
VWREAITKTRYTLTTLWLFGAAIYAGSTVALLQERDHGEPVDLADINLLEVETQETGSPGNDKPASPHARHQEWVEVTSAVNMRQGPSSSYSVLTVQPQGQYLPVTDRDGNWLQILDPETEEEGWVFSRYVEEVQIPGDQAAAWTPEPDPEQ